VSQKRINFETVWLKITLIDFDDIWQKYLQYPRIEFACVSLRVGLFLSTFCRSNQTPKITQILKIIRVTLPVNMAP